MSRWYGWAFIRGQIYPLGITIHTFALRKKYRNLVTIMGLSKMESLSDTGWGRRLEMPKWLNVWKFQAIMSLRCSGYNQAVFTTWFNEPEGWMTARQQHKEIHDVIMENWRRTGGLCKTGRRRSLSFIRILNSDIILIILSDCPRDGWGHGSRTEFDPKCIWQFRINFSQDKDKAVAGIERLLQIKGTVP